MRFLLDTNIVIKLEPEDLAGVENDVAAAMEVNRLIAHGQHSLVVHPAIKADIARDQDRRRAERTTFLLNKYYELQQPPSADQYSAVLGSPSARSTDGVDNQLIAAVADEIVDYLITEDQRLLRKLARVAPSERGLTIKEAVVLLRSLYDVPGQPPPSVNATLMHTLNREDPIWDSFRQDYANFDQWFNRVRADNRPAWTITPDDQLAAVAIAKREDDSPYGLSGRVLKVTNFKVADEHQGRKYGELLLKSIFGFAHGNQYSYIYVTAFEHHSGLIAVLEDFGFTAVDRVDTTDEIVLAKTLLPSGAGDEQLSPLDYHLSLGPPAIHPLSENWFIVPIEPRFHTALFPSPGDQPTLPGIDEWPRGYGNAIKKAYLSRTSSRRVTPGATLLFYRSHDLHAVRAVGIAERIVVSGDPQVLASFVSSRTVYSYPEIENMATDREVVAILFRHDRDLPAPISLRELIDHDALLQAPQSIASCRSEGIEWLKQRISVS